MRNEAAAFILITSMNETYTQEELLDNLANKEYEFGFTTNVENETIPKGLSEETVRLISSIKQEPEYMLEYRLRAFRKWQTMKMPHWAHLRLPEIDFQDIIYYSAPKRDPKYSDLNEIDPELKSTFDKLGIPLEEQKLLAGVKGVAIDAVMDSSSVKTTFRETLAEKGVIFCSMSEAIREYPDLIRNYLGSVVPSGDNYFAALNSDRKSVV